MSYEDLKQMDAHIKSKEKIYHQKPLRKPLKIKSFKTKHIRNRRMPPIKTKGNKYWIGDE